MPIPVYELNSLYSNQRPNLRRDALEIFFDSDRPGSFGSTDLWSATRHAAFESWSQPSNLGALVNSDAMDGRPSTSFNGKTLYFMSSRAGTTPGSTGAPSTDLYVTTRKRQPKWIDGSKERSLRQQPIIAVVMAADAANVVTRLNSS